ncbi:MAG TPA: hypothetical protein V6D48_00565 [Oculatellaceae cyanobacterium]
MSSNATKKTKTKSPPTTTPTNNLPPVIPGTAEGLQRAIVLLGSRAKGELTNKPKGELMELIGTYPTPEQAVVWKSQLKQLTKEK